MFFERNPGFQSPSSKSHSQAPMNKTESPSVRVKRRRLAAIGLAAAVVVPALTARISGLYAQDAAKPADAPLMPLFYSSYEPGRRAVS